MSTNAEDYPVDHEGISLTCIIYENISGQHTVQTRRLSMLMILRA